MNAEFTAEITPSIQDYLKAIYELTEGGQAASTNAIAHRLRISPASVTGMVQKMAAARPALLSYKKHQGVRLAESGRRAALRVIRSHRLLESWLVQSLGYSWDEVHGEAERLEHAMSPDLERRISAALGNPTRDPHGDPIPTATLNMPDEKTMPLDKLVTGAEAIVRRVDSRDSDALQQLDRLGIQLGSVLRVLERSAVDQLTSLRVDGRKGNVTLGPALSGRIHVETRVGSDANRQGK